MRWTDIKKTFDQLCEYKGELKKVARYKLRNVKGDPFYLNVNNYCIIPTGCNNSYYTLNYLTDCFTENARLEARRYDQEMSPADYWRKNHQQIKQQNPNATKRELRDILYQSTVEVMNFRLTVATTILDLFHPTTVFDPCAGHGDRAIATMSRDYVKHYEACEPNLASQTGITKAIQVFSQKPFVVHPVPFEDFDFQDKYFDMVLTSPPFFDLEIYSLDATQSIVRYPDQDQWYIEFLLPMFLRCWQCIKPHGHMVISINNARDRKTGDLRFYCTEKLIHDLSHMCKNAKFLGTISVGNDTEKRLEPIFIWQKDCDTVPAKHIMQHRVVAPQWERELTKQNASKKVRDKFVGIEPPNSQTQIRDIVYANILLGL